MKEAEIIRQIINYFLHRSNMLILSLSASQIHENKFYNLPLLYKG